MPTQLNVPLSHLSAGKNPRKVKASPEAHRSLVALIRAHGLLQPLVVRPSEKPKHYVVFAGGRRLAALREIHRGEDPKIPCVLRDVDTVTADAMALGENFAREPMHPLDEAEAFAKLATAEGKDADTIAAEFGVTERVCRQRMKLSTLAKALKAACREGAIDTATAEAFAAVPEDRQMEVWEETGGHPRHAEHVRNIIANRWIDAKHALFDLTALPPTATSQDLFSERVLVDRQAFLEAQARALETQQKALTEDGWANVVLGRREDVQDRLYAMDPPDRMFDAATERKLKKIAERREKLQAAADTLDENDEERLTRTQAKYEALEAQEQELLRTAPEQFSEETKALATAFLILDPDGRAHREYRVPRQRNHPSHGHHHGDDGSGTSADGKAKPPTSDDLSDKQLAATFTHQALAVREALLGDAATLKRVLALILHDKVRSEALSIRHDANGTTVVTTQDGFTSACLDRLTEKRADLDPFSKQHVMDDVAAFEALGKLSDAKIDTLIDLLIAECIHAHMVRPTQLVQRLAETLQVDVRNDWRPDADWLSGYQKIQLAHLIGELKGAMHAPLPERKKSDLVTELAKLFADAAAGTLADKKLAERVNRWLPSNLRKGQTEGK